jgi:ABC-2 type transport system ATP-binding protein
MREVVAEGRTVFLSSHVLSEVGDVADRVGLIREGRVVAVQRVEDLRRRSVHLVDATARAPFPVDAFARLVGVVHGEVRGTMAHLEISGEIDPVIKALAGYELEDLSVREPSLEELFLAFYQADGDR